MPNPPKLDPSRGHRGRGPVLLPAAGRVGPTPEWPLSGFTPDEQEAWRQPWATPQAVAWEKLGWVRTIARYCRVMVSAEASDSTGAILAQATALEDRLGLTPKSMRLLLWQIAVDELAEKRDESTPSTSARGRLKAV